MQSLPMTDAGNLTVRSEKGIKYERVYSREEGLEVCKACQ